MRGNDAINQGGFSFIRCPFILSRSRLIFGSCFLAFPASHTGSSPSPPLLLGFPLFRGDVEMQSSKDFPCMNIVAEPQASQIQKSVWFVPFSIPYLGGRGRNSTRAFPSPFSSSRRTSRLPRWSHQTSRSATWVCSYFRGSSSNLWWGGFLLSFHTLLPTCSQILEEHAEMQL